ncbi:MAG: DGQHR domain-containing protein, partial [Terriglobia bacterium]
MATRETFTRDLRKQYSSSKRRQLKYAFFLSHVTLGDTDLERANQQGVAVFDDVDLAYYEALVLQVGLAARFQFLADLLPGKRIEGLELTVPAVRTKMGGYHCFTFSVSPEYLLKIAYVSHRSKGKASDVDTYQRMIKKNRLRRIREYITNDGIFPTNIVVNLKTGCFYFQRAKQEDDSGTEARFGWLKLKPSYKSAWIIDGQHRLFAYAGHPRAEKSLVAVLAFSGLPPSDQARLFIDINAEQKKVKQSLLQELYAELNWGAEDPEVRVRAILSKAIQALDMGQDSPFRGRILKADERRTDRRCITLTALFSALEKPGFFISQLRKGEVIEFGPLWA